MELAQAGRLDYLAFECLAERTIALAQTERLSDPNAGFDPLLSSRMEAVLPACAAQGVKIITNMGAANPVGAARKVVEVARRLGLSGLKVAAVSGDDVLEVVRRENCALLERPGRVSDLGDSIISANAYLGADPIVRALGQGADVVITGRVGDPALFLAPMIHEFGWGETDWDLLASGTVVGHLLECAGQLTGGYFADPGFKDVPGLARLGFPIAEVGPDGAATFSKVEGSGGAITLATCKEQLLYEILDPSAYRQADVTSDFSAVRVDQIGKDRVAVAGARGLPRPDTLKVSIGYRDGYIGEGQISYAGPGAVGRGELALAIVRERLALIGSAAKDLRFEMIGVNALNPAVSPDMGQAAEVRVRVAGRAATAREAERIGGEVESLYTNGPAGGGGAWKSARPVTAIVSALIPRELVTSRVDMEVA